ncbi:hypothetical protein [Phthorimaea operculella granulovirus]|uniref:Uncharacterized protein n=1 Tax=Phthorimaea operculella granulovirus TaxID=192584 RepID=Q8JRV7_9BBAC|nr:hypothetical protein [Phthorimaea operculella granulovirus]AAM70300.1 hypothetical protein [Phthorimaea operculella granulovirus]ANY57491.1 hypothetical protein PhopGVgp102 [Phthorimaea operculella granulovirus]QBH65937.1 hypothetical protein PhopGVgp102 [Phthorimaea operculella granulovirus]QBH66067.1 hypothetical protein PhopGVgp102 [Phthorimaea operculella granulovirus]QBH66197.1 hypothetical protein PhopGVgp102 [Phthorimaea operculella granulovirus]
MMISLIESFISISGKYELWKYYNDMQDTLQMQKIVESLECTEKNVRWARYYKKKHNPKSRGMYKAYEWILSGLRDDQRKYFMENFDEDTDIDLEYDEVLVTAMQHEIRLMTERMKTKIDIV